MYLLKMAAITSTIDFNALAGKLYHLSAAEKVGYGFLGVIGLYILNAVLPRVCDRSAYP